MDAGAYRIVPDRRNIIGFWVLAPFPMEERGFFSCFIEAGGLFGKGAIPLFQEWLGRTIKKNIKNKG